jgi:division/cell wall cluster transcriptional repressor MraZ
VKAVGAAFPVGRARKTVDSKGRVQLPASQAAALGSAVYVCPGHGHFLEIHSERNWHRYLAKLVLAAERGPSRFRGLLRHVLGSATPCRIDPQARLVIPKDVLDWAKLEVPADRDSLEVFVVGVGECVEVWNPGDFKSDMEPVIGNLPKLWDEMRSEYVAAGADLASMGEALELAQGDEPE